MTVSFLSVLLGTPLDPVGHALGCSPIFGFRFVALPGKFLYCIFMVQAEAIENKSHKKKSVKSIMGNLIEWQFYDCRKLCSHFWTVSFSESLLFFIMIFDVSNTTLIRDLIFDNRLDVHRNILGSRS